MGHTRRWEHQFFHAIATVKHNKSNIRSLKDNNVTEIFKHEEKALIIWEAFRDRLGVSEFPNIHSELNGLIQPVNLDCLVEPFQQGKMDSIIKELKSGKSPGLDGFNTDFMKKWWSVIK
jgi:hypothetical protein